AQSLVIVVFTQEWINPWGDVFIRALKLIAIPLIIFSLIDGVSNHSYVTRLSRIGGKTIALYLSATVDAVLLRLEPVNLIQPGKLLSPEKREELREAYASDMDQRVTTAHEVSTEGPLQPLVDIVPENFFGTASDNANMLQIIFF